MTQIKLPVELTTKEIPTLNTAIAKELSLEDNTELFLQLISQSGELP